jgi:hypothetical protein
VEEMESLREKASDDQVEEVEAEEVVESLWLALFDEWVYD